jgi:transcriptional regulator
MQQEIRAKICNFTVKLVKKGNVRNNSSLIFTQSGESPSLFPYFSKMLEVNMKNKIVNRKLRDGN